MKLNESSYVSRIFFININDTIVILVWYYKNIFTSFEAFVKNVLDMAAHL